MSDKFALIAAKQASSIDERPLSLSAVCLAVAVSRSGFYDWLNAQPSARAVRRVKVAEHVKAAFTLGRGTYGVRRVHAVLARSHDPEVASVSLDLVRALMQENDLHACQPRAYRVTAPGTGLVCDITYIRAWAGWIYLATVIDCQTKAVIGWSMA